MKKIFLFSILIVSSFLLIPRNTDASTLLNATTAQELHEELKDSELVYLNENGLFTLSEDLITLGVNEELAMKYDEMLAIINNQIQKGFISFDEQMNAVPFTVFVKIDVVFSLFISSLNLKKTTALRLLTFSK